MPRDANGVYSLPSIYLAVTGTTIIAAQHNGPLEDIEQALTESLARSGVAPMTGPLKLSDGDAATPALRFNSIAGRGLYKTTDGIGFSVGGQKVVEITADGLIGLPIGTPISVLDDTLPPLCIWADGRNVSRTSYAALFAKWASKFGAGDGSTTFGVPDLRSVPLVGRDNIGGTDANRLAGVPVVSGDRLTTGSIIGEIGHALTVAELASHPHGINLTPNFNDVYTLVQLNAMAVASGVTAINWVFSSTTTTTPNSITISGNTANAGSGAAHNTVQRSFLCNFAIYAGA